MPDPASTDEPTQVAGIKRKMGEYGAARPEASGRGSIFSAYTRVPAVRRREGTEPVKQLF